MSVIISVYETSYFIAYCFLLNIPKYIAYALPEEYSAAPQSDFSFIEVTENNAPKGFFVIYQDAFTGKLVSP